MTSHRLPFDRRRGAVTHGPRRTRRLGPRGRALLSLLALAAPPLLAQPGPLFPQPFRVEHHLVQLDGDGSRFVGQSIVDTYGGSWIVSERPDGSRVIVDLVRREITEVRRAKGSYWTVSFDRLAELQARLQRAQGLSGTARTAGDDVAAATRAGTQATVPSPATPAAARSADELVVTEVPAAEERASRVGGPTDAAGAALIARAGVEHLRVERRDDPEGAGLDVWLDPSVRLTTAAQAALGALESQVLTARAPAAAGKASAASSPSRYLAAARTRAGGAVPIRTVRSLKTSATGAAMGSVEDVATRLEPLERFPGELVEIPEGLRRVPHPLEATVRFLEEEAVRNAQMAGAASPQ